MALLIATSMVHAGRRGGGVLTTKGKFTLTGLGDRAGGGELGENDIIQPLDGAPAWTATTSATSATPSASVRLEELFSEPLQLFKQQHQSNPKEHHASPSFFTNTAMVELGEATQSSTILAPTMIVTIQAHSGKFCSWGSQSGCTSKTASRSSEHFAVLDAGAGRIALASANRHSSKAPMCAPAEGSFQVVDVSAEKVAFKMGSTFCVPTPALVCTGEAAATDITPQATFKITCIHNCKKGQQDDKADDTSDEPEKDSADAADADVVGKPRYNCPKSKFALPQGDRRGGSLDWNTCPFQETWTGVEEVIEKLAKSPAGCGAPTRDTDGREVPAVDCIVTTTDESLISLAVKCLNSARRTLEDNHVHGNVSEYMSVQMKFHKFDACPTCTCPNGKPFIRVTDGKGSCEGEDFRSICIKSLDQSKHIGRIPAARSDFKDTSKYLPFLAALFKHFSDTFQFKDEQSKLGQLALISPRLGWAPQDENTGIPGCWKIGGVSKPRPVSWMALAKNQPPATYQVNHPACAEECKTTMMPHKTSASVAHQACPVKANPDDVKPVVVAGARHTCDLSAKGKISCWGADDGAGLMRAGQSSGPRTHQRDTGETFMHVAAGGDTTCGIVKGKESGGKLRCWGSMTTEDADYFAKDMLFQSVSVGTDHICGIAMNTSFVTCWGSMDKWPGAGRGLLGASIGNNGCDTKCLNAGGKVKKNRCNDDICCGCDIAAFASKCGGQKASSCPTPTPTPAPPPNKPSEVPSPAPPETPKVSTRRRKKFPGQGRAGKDPEGNRVFGVPKGVAFSSVAVGKYHSCGILKDTDEIKCWGENSSGELDAPKGKYKAVVCGNRYSCGLTKEEGQIHCWCPKEGPQGRPGPQCNMYDGAVIYEHVPPNMHILVNGTKSRTPVHKGDYFPKHFHTNGGFVKLSAGAMHTCAVNNKGNAFCWGVEKPHIQEFRVSGVPAQFYTDVACGREHTCGLFDNGAKVTCWGSDKNYQGLRGMPRNHKLAFEPSCQTEHPELSGPTACTSCGRACSFHTIIHPKQNAGTCTSRPCPFCKPRACCGEGHKHYVVNSESLEGVCVRHNDDCTPACVPSGDNHPQKQRVCSKGCNLLVRASQKEIVVCQADKRIICKGTSDDRAGETDCAQEKDVKPVAVCTLNANNADLWSLGGTCISNWVTGLPTPNCPNANWANKLIGSKGSNIMQWCRKATKGCDPGTDRGRELCDKSAMEASHCASLAMSF